MANSGRLTHHGPVLAALTRGTTTLEVFTEPALALLLARWPHAEASRGSDPCEDLERNYEVLTGVAGRPISRPGPGAALLRCLGLTEFAKRFSHLTSRRRLAAHPDSCLLQQLRSKLESLDPAVREEGVFKFLAKGPAGSAGWAAPPTGSPGTSTSARDRAKAVASGSEEQEDADVEDKRHYVPVLIGHLRSANRATVWLPCVTCTLPWVDNRPTNSALEGRSSDSLLLAFGRLAVVRSLRSLGLAVLF